VRDDGTEQIERLYREQGPRLWRAVFAWSGDSEVTSDAVAEAFMQLLGRGAGVRNPQPWVWRTAFKIASGELKDRGTRGVGVQVPDRAVDAPQPLAELLGALQGLSEKQRAAFILRHYAGYDAREIATMIGSTPPAVRVHLSAARRRLRASISEGAVDA
jgi:RNA polymerase sigma-70 factor (ECF subfamily)